MSPWKIGDRVTREVFADDGTWAREGDECLKRSPLRHGTVVARHRSRRRWQFSVRWDDGSVGSGYLIHGIDAERRPATKEKNGFFDASTTPIYHGEIGCSWAPGQNILCINCHRRVCYCGGHDAGTIDCEYMCDECCPCDADRPQRGREGR